MGGQLGDAVPSRYLKNCKVIIRKNSLQLCINEKIYQVCVIVCDVSRMESLKYVDVWKKSLENQGVTHTLLLGNKVI